METRICDISALRFWRAPPIVRQLAAGDEEMLRGAMAPDDLISLRAELLETLPLCSLFQSGPQWRKTGGSAAELKKVFLAFAACFDGPVDVLVQDRKDARPSKLIRPRLWSGELPFGSFVQITDGISVASPELALQQVAARSSWIKTLMIASELCGSFSVYKAPASIERRLQKLLNSNISRLRLNGWSPYFEGTGLSSLWNRAPLTGPHALKEFAEETTQRNGREKMRLAAELVTPGAASPLEVQTALLLGLSRRRGGKGLGGFEHNAKVALSPNAQLLAQRNHCYCDLFWEDAGLDVECQSKMVHDNEESLISDFDRAAALEQMGIRVLFASHDMLGNRDRFDAFAKLVAERLGRRLKPETEKERRAATQLRAELLIDWAKLI